MPPTALTDCRTVAHCDEYRDALTEEASAILTRADTDIAGDDLARFETIETELTALRTRRGQLERLERAAQAQNNPADGARDFQHQRRVDPFDGDPLDMRGNEVLDRAMALLERRGDHLDDQQTARVEQLFRSVDGECRGDYLAKRALITETDAYRSAFTQVLTEPHPVLSDAEARALKSLKALEREMNITTPGDGGYGVPVLIDPSIIVTDQGTMNPFRQIATWKTITTKDWRGVSAAGVTWAFETESAAANDISPTLAQPIIHAHKAQGFIPFSIEVGMDYPDFSGEMAKLLGEGYEELLVDKFTRGSGTGEPWGVFEACEQATSQVAVTTDATFTAYDVLQVWKALPQKYRGRASWLMNVDVNNEIRLFGDDELSKQTVNLTAGAADMILGKAVYETPYAPEFTGTTGASSILIVGDFSKFYVAQRAGMNVELAQLLFDTSSGTPNGQRGLYAWTRVGSDVVVDNGFRMLVNT